MSVPFYIFPDPLDAQATLTSDSGIVMTGVPATHPTGRPGQRFDIPETVPQGIGAQLILKAQNKTTLVLRGILWITRANFPYNTGLMVDDFKLADASVKLPRLVPQGEFLAQEDN